MDNCIVDGAASVENVALHKWKLRRKFRGFAANFQRFFRVIQKQYLVNILLLLSKTAGFLHSFTFLMTKGSEPFVVEDLPAKYSTFNRLRMLNMQETDFYNIQY